MAGLERETKECRRGGTETQRTEEGSVQSKVNKRAQPEQGKQEQRARESACTAKSDDKRADMSVRPWSGGGTLAHERDKAKQRGQAQDERQRPELCGHERGNVVLGREDICSCHSMDRRAGTNRTDRARTVLARCAAEGAGRRGLKRCRSQARSLSMMASEGVTNTFSLMPNMRAMMSPSQAASWRRRHRRPKPCEQRR